MKETNLENEIIEKLILWDNYIDFDQRFTGNIFLIKEYLEFRLILMGLLNNDYEKTKRAAQEINEKNYIKIWFHLDSVLNKQSLMDMKQENEYIFKKRFRGITAVKIEKLQDPENNESI